MSSKSTLKRSKSTRKHHHRRPHHHRRAAKMEIRNYALQVVQSLTLFELDEFREAFMQFDKDGNGTISTSEMTIIMRSFGKNPTEQVAFFHNR